MKKINSLILFSIMIIGITIALYLLINLVLSRIVSTPLKIIIWIIIVIIYVLIVIKIYLSYIKHLNERLEAKRIKNFIHKLSSIDLDPFIRLMYSVVSDDFFSKLDKSNKENPRVKSYSYRITSPLSDIFATIYIQLKGSVICNIEIAKDGVEMSKIYKGKEVKSYSYEDFDSTKTLIERLIQDI